MRAKLALLFVALILVPILVLIENHDALIDLRDGLRSSSVPLGALETGKLGKSLRNHGLVRIEPNDDSRFPLAQQQGEDGETLLFKNKRKVGANMFTASADRGYELPSTQVIEAEDFEPGWPLISVVSDKENLYHPETGIFAMDQERGRDWERSAYVSYFENGELKFASGAGIRLHGGSVRHRIREKRIRLYFRNEYGAHAFTPGLLFGPETEPLRTIVVRKDDQAFATPLAFDISRRLGALAPDTKPVLFFINGKSLGKYYLTEHLSSKQWASHFGHEQFLFYRYKSGDQRPGEYGRLLNWARNLDSPLTMEAVGRVVDLDNLSRHLLSVVYCATNDWVQGVAVRDESKPGAKWFFINWDMDHSFVDFGAAWKQGKRPKWRQEAFELIFSHINFRDRPNPDRPINYGDIRRVIFTRLWKDSPEYRAYFLRLTMDLLNHRLTRTFLLSRLAYYQDVLEVEHREDREEFLLHRGEFLREELQKYFDAGEIHHVTVRSDEDVQFDIDGYPEAPGYEGEYFENQEITVSVAKGTASPLDHWSVNGQQHRDSLLTITIGQDMVIEPVFH